MFSAGMSITQSINWAKYTEQFTVVVAAHLFINLRQTSNIIMYTTEMKILHHLLTLFLFTFFLLTQLFLLTLY